jgi:glyoxylase-like metal-dependent hydrolase (beta-lactamase superfamily II)
MQVTPNVRAVQVPDENPMHPQYTTIYLVGRDQALTIDSGEDRERYRWMLKGYLAATEKAEIALSAVTHYHADHSANLRWLRDEFGAEVHAFEQSIPLLGARLPESGVHALQDGAAVQVAGGVEVQVIHSPGHSSDSVCYYIEDEGVLFTGDTVLGGTTTTVNDLGAYLSTLQRLRALPNLQLICPGHGPIIHDPTRWIDSYVAHREERERQIVELLADGRGLTSWQIMEVLYTGIDARLRRLADGNVRAHLDKLAQEGRLKVYAGTPGQKPSDEAARDQAGEHARLEVIRRAETYREEMRQRELLREESPAEEWIEPPRYELA